MCSAVNYFLEIKCFHCICSARAVRIFLRGGRRAVGSPDRPIQAERAVIRLEPRPGDANGLAVRLLFESPLVVVTGIRSRWEDMTELAELAEGDWLKVGTQARLPKLASMLRLGASCRRTAWRKRM